MVIRMLNHKVLLRKSCRTAVPKKKLGLTRRSNSETADAVIVVFLRWEYAETPGHQPQGPVRVIHICSEVR